MAFEISKHLIKVQGGRTYLPVAARLIWFREEHKDWGIITEAVTIDMERQYAIFRASIVNADGKVIATATKCEDVKGFGDFAEKAETGAVGRALAYCGYGTQFAPELEEGGANQERHEETRYVNANIRPPVQSGRPNAYSTPYNAPRQAPPPNRQAPPPIEDYRETLLDAPPQAPTARRDSLDTNTPAGRL